MRGLFEFWRHRVVEYAPESMAYPVVPGVYITHVWDDSHNARILVTTEGGYEKPCTLPQ